MKMIIEKDKILNCYIVWEVHLNYKIDRFRSKLKRECNEFIKKLNIV
jgi:hypothetical protein